MKNFSAFIAVSALFILFGYISFNEKRYHTKKDTISDETVAEMRYVVEDLPFPAISLDIPESIDFAGEPVPMDISDVRERLDKELQINTYFHSNTIFLIKRANRWLPQIEKILKKHGVPDDFKYLPLIESNLLNDISPKNAVGYWQILKASGKEYGLEITDEVDERYDPLKATEAACKYLNQAYRKFGNWTLVAASYNRGMGGIERALENQHVKTYYDLFLNEETARYVFRLLAIKEIIENPLKYGFRINPKHLFQEEALKYVEVNETIKDLVNFARQHNTNYKLIKRHNPWLRDDKLTVKKNRQYQIAIPQYQ
jgi:hypothetical protein